MTWIILLPHFSTSPPHTTSIIDLAITNNVNLFHHFSVDTGNTLLSDHRAIIVSLTSRSHPTTIPLRYVWRTHDHDVPWILFQQQLTILLQTWRDRWEHMISHNQQVEQSDIDECWSQLHDIIKHAAHKTIKKKAIRHTSQHWFTIDPLIPSLHQTYIRLRRARDRMGPKSRTIPTHLNNRYRDARHKFNDAMRCAKQKCWEELVKQVDNNHRIIWTAWHKTTPSASTSLPTFKSNTHGPPTSPIENLNILARHFQSVSTLPDDQAFNKSQDATVH